MRATYHPGERSAQDRAGVGAIAARVARSIHWQMPAAAQEFLAAQKLLFVAARDADGRVWASALHGPAGFARAIDPRTLAIAALPSPHDPLHRTLAAGPAEVGLLGLEPPTRRRMRVNGMAESRDGTLFVRTRQVYANCPKYIQRRETPPAMLAPRPGAPSRADRLSAADRDLIGRADTFVIATAEPRGGTADASHRGGSPGFVAVHDQRHLSFGDYSGNSMFNTLGNLELDPASGLLLIDPGSGGLVQLTGRARVDWDPRRAARVPGAQRMVDFELDEILRTPTAIPPLGRLIERSPHNPAVRR